MASAINWFQIPATDIARAKTFYETICGFPLEKMEMPEHGDVVVPRRPAKR